MYSVLVALIAIHAVPDIAAHAAVLRIGCRLGVANGALENRVVGGIRVARGANPVGASMTHREIRVVEGRAGPGRGGVAGAAVGRRKCGSSRGVIWVGRPVVVRRMATVTIRRQRRVVVVDVAARARNRRSVKSGQREGGGVVIEGRAGPGRRRVAQGAIRGKRCGNVIGHRSAKRRSAQPCGGVAAITRRRSEAVVVVHMAGNAGCRRGRNVHSRQDKPGARVIKHASSPC